MLKLWNTLHRKLEAFEPIKPGHVGLYTCGPTVYNPVTLGNWRAFLFDDFLSRSLLSLGFEVTHVMNITDVGHLVGDGDEGEDKVEREATKRGVNAWELAREYETKFLTDMSAFGIVRPTILPRATEHIAEQIVLIQTLEEKGFTYRTSDGIYFDTAKFPAYGRLSGQKLEEKEAGARVVVNPEKRNATDFALWKFLPTDKKRQMEWDSPWGKGFPGWHIECSAMSVKYLGQPFDIHCGGIDHIPVHHENEIAQSEAANGKPLANYWLHNEFLTIDGGRMGKSLGNAYTIEDLTERGFDPLAFRFFCLGAHYRSKLNFTWEALEGAAQALKKLQAMARQLEPSSVNPDDLATFRQSLEDDLNTPKALAAMWDLLKSDIPSDRKGAALLVMDETLGLGLTELVGHTVAIPSDIIRLAEERQTARAAKDWKKSDELRDEMEKLGFTIKDQPNGEYDILPS